ncbi:MAG: PHP domain-containing protein [Planctomycetota bacterium]|nr:MAG: PHP domain-containing protein [Planctomycetota bacterium]
MIDLHVHTTASDGLHAPREVVALAARAGADVIAITDHDTAAGARALGLGTSGARSRTIDGVEVVAGIEVTASAQQLEVHVLGYFIDASDPSVLRFESERAARRRARLERMVRQLAAAGFPIAIEEVFEQTGGEGAPGRPHVARALVARGHVRSTREAFERLLLPGCPGYVAYERPSVREAASLITGAGGVAVLAHPGLDRLVDRIEQLVGEGLCGIEVRHSAHDPDVTEAFDRLAQARGWLRTGGSDFHGLAVEEGGAIGSVPCPRGWFEALRRAADRPAGAPKREAQR